MDRRRWMKAGVGGLVAAVGTGWLVVRAWLPWISRGPDGRWRLGPRERFAPGSATLLRRAQAILVRDEKGGVHALSAICTHEGCTVHDTPSRREITCPCHGTAYDYRGQVKRGPAIYPLPWLALSEEKGELVLDETQNVPPDPA